MILFPHDILCLLNDNELNNDLFFSFLAYFLTYVNYLLTVFNQICQELTFYHIPVLKT